MGEWTHTHTQAMMNVRQIRTAEWSETEQREVLCTNDCWQVLHTCSASKQKSPYLHIPAMTKQHGQLHLFIVH